MGNKTFRINFKTREVVYITGSTLSKAIIASGLKPFLVIDVESITQIK